MVSHLSVNGAYACQIVCMFEVHSKCAQLYGRNLLLLLFPAIEFSLGGSGPYTSNK